MLKLFFFHQPTSTKLLFIVVVALLQKMGLATGIAVAGTGVGQFVIPPFSEWLLSSQGVFLAYVILAGVFASAAVFAMAFGIPDGVSASDDVEDKGLFLLDN